MVVPLFRGIIWLYPDTMPDTSKAELARRLIRMGRRPSIMPDRDHNPGFLLQLPQGRDGWLVARRIRVARRGLAVLGWTLFAMLIQALCLLLPGQAKVTFARVYWAVF